MEPKPKTFLAHTAINRAILLSFILLVITGQDFNHFTDLTILFYVAITIFLSLLFPYLIKKSANLFISRLLLPFGYSLTVLGILGVTYHWFHSPGILMLAIGIGLINGRMYELAHNHLFLRQQNQLHPLSKLAVTDNLAKIFIIIILGIDLHFKLSQTKMTGLVFLLLISFLLYLQLNKTTFKTVPLSEIHFSKPEKLILVTMAFVYAVLWQPFYLFLFLMIKYINPPLTESVWTLLIPSVIFLVFTPVISGLFNYLRKGNLEPSNFYKLISALSLLSIAFIFMSICPLTYLSIIVLFVVLGFCSIFTIPVLQWLLVTGFQKTPANFIPVVNLLTGILIILFTGLYVLMETNILLVFAVLSLLLLVIFIAYKPSISHKNEVGKQS